MEGDWLPPQPPGDPPPPPERPPIAPPRPPPAYQPQPPPGYTAPPLQQPSPYASSFPPPAYHAVYTPQPPNDDAVVGFTCAVVGGALLFFTAGLSTLISLGLGIAAIPYARKGKRAIAEGRTQKHKDLANAGYVIGIVVIVLAALATVFWGFAIAVALTEPGWIDDSDDDPFDEDFRFQVVLRVLAAAGRLVG